MAEANGGCSGRLEHRVIERRLLVDGLEILLVRKRRELAHLWRVAPHFLRDFPAQELLAPVAITRKGNLLFEGPALAAEDLLTVMDVHSGRKRCRDIDRPAPDLACAVPLAVAFPLVIALAERIAREPAPYLQLSPMSVLVNFDGTVDIAPPMLSSLVNRACISCCGDVTQRFEFTNRYIAPEVAGGGTPDRRSEAFSIIALFYELTTGRDPLGGSVGMRRVWMARDCAIAPARTNTIESLPAPLSDFLDATLNAPAGDRPNGGAECAAVLRRLAGDCGIDVDTRHVSGFMEELFGVELAERCEAPRRDAFAPTSLYCAPVEAALSGTGRARRRRRRNQAAGAPPAPSRKTLRGVPAQVATPPQPSSVS